jgi:hypothetical protein
LFYGYATGVFSSRKLEASTHESVAFRYIAANTHPDHDTIATFRKRFLEELKEQFVQILLIAKEMGVIKLGAVSFDGTKVAANASKHKALSYDYACRLEAQLKAEVAELLKKAEEADRADIPDGMSIPEELQIRTKRLEKIAQAKAEIERRAQQRYEEERKQYEKKLVERANKQQETGKKPRGKEPKAPTSGPTATDQVNLTDEESRIMPVSGGGFDQAYNAQAAVDTQSMLIVENHVSQKTNDKQEIEPAVKNLKALPEKLGTVTDIISDNGFYSEENVKTCIEHTITPYIALDREQHNQSPFERFEEPPPPEDNADWVTQMKHRLKTAAGKSVYRIRKSTIEPVFGIIKAVMGFRRFMLRGFKSAQGEWNLVCMAFNIKRLHALAK